MDSSTEDSLIFEAKPHVLPQFYDPRKQGKAFTRKHLAIEETPVKYFDQALAEIDVNANEEITTEEIKDIDKTSEEELSITISEQFSKKEKTRDLRYLRN